VDELESKLIPYIRQALPDKDRGIADNEVLKIAQDTARTEDILYQKLGAFREAKSHLRDLNRYRALRDHFDQAYSLAETLRGDFTFEKIRNVINDHKLG